MIPVAERLNSIHEYYFSKKLEQIRVMNEQGRDVINLGIGSPDLPPSPETLQAAIQSLHNPRSHGYSSYRGGLELRQGVSDWYEKTYQVSARAADEILPLLGSKEGLFYVAMAFLNPGDKALVPNPGYPAYAAVTQLAGAHVMTYELCEENQWQPDLETLSRQDLRGVKLMWVNYPHMPTGQKGSEELFQKLVAFGRQHNILICHDNPYGLVLNKENPLSLLRFDPGKAVSLELNSFSKAFNMAGWRVGFLIGSAAVVEAVLRVKSNVDSGMFSAVQAGAVQALQNSSTWHQERNAIYAERRQWVYQIFDRLGCRYSRDQVGLFVWARVSDSIPQVEVWVDQVLSERAVFLTPGFIFGSQGERYLRASLCAPVERLQLALQRLEKRP